MSADSYIAMFICECGYGETELIQDDPSVAYDDACYVWSMMKTKHYEASLNENPCDKKPKISYVKEA